jgi:hypothetical protein
MKRARVTQPLDALSYGELAVCVLARDVFRAAHLFGHIRAALDFFNLFFPAQSNASRQSITS